MYIHLKYVYTLEIFIHTKDIGKLAIKYYTSKKWQLKINKWQLNKRSLAASGW